MSKTLLVTGATGFLGSYLVKRLLQDGHKVVILKRSFSNTRRIHDVLSQLIWYDIDHSSLDKPFQEIEHIDAVIHTATCYGRNQESASFMLENNTFFPLQLLQTAIQFKTSTFFNTDTIIDKFLNAYSLSKKQFMEWGNYLAKSKEIRFVNVQLQHMLGPDDDDSKFTSYVIQSCLNNIKELDLTAGEQRRDFVYIDDVTSAYSILLEKAEKQLELYQNYEVGSGQAVSIRELVEKVHHLTQSKTVLKFGVLPYRDGEVMYSKANIKAMTELGWEPKTNLEIHLRQTIEAEKNARSKIMNEFE